MLSTREFLTFGKSSVIINVLNPDCPRFVGRRVVRKE